jgi:ABC-type transporter Mla subunit MlaD
VFPPTSSLARPVGYLLVAGFLVLGAFFAVFAVREFRDPGTTVRVRFPEISTLSEGDPVVENGVAAGRVESIRLDSVGALVALKLDRRELPPVDTRFVNFSHSLMGARKVWIRRGVSPLPLDASRIQEGAFVPGLPEALHKVRVLNERLAAWREASDRLLGGGDSAAIVRAVGAMERAFARLAALDTSMGAAAADLRAGVERLSGLETKASAAARGGGQEVSAASKRVATARASLAGLESGLSASLSRLEALAAAVDADTGVAYRLLADRKLYDSLVGGMENLTAVARRFRDEGLSDSVKVRPHWGKRGGAAK